MSGVVDVRLDDDLQVSYQPGEKSAIAVVITYEDNLVVSYETNSRPWDEGIIQVRNVTATNLDEYSRAETLRLLNDAVPAHESELRALFE